MPFGVPTLFNLAQLLLRRHLMIALPTR